jgi:hypothetical protein
MDRALPFIEDAVEAARPFLAVVWFHSPHLPVVTGEEYRRLYRELLYDLRSDPSESQDVASRRPGIVEEMTRQLRTWQESCARSDRGEDYREATSSRKGEP